MKLPASMLFVIVFLFGGAAGGGKPHIAKIRKAYARIEQGIEMDEFSYRKHSEYNGSIVRSAAIYTDDRGRVVKLRCSGGSEDSAHEADYYYRPDGTIFFAYLRSANVAECETELRIYFDTAGRPVRRVKKEGKKCGYSFAYPEKIADPQEGYRKFCEVGGS